MQHDSSASRRLASLDILRGFDLFMLLFLQPVLWSVGSVWSAPWFDAVMHQLDHEVWQGFRCWDLVMPLFLFMTGAAMPLSFRKYVEGGGSRRPLYRRIARRVLVLFFLGMVVQGNLLAFDFGRLLIYNNTLQAIAVGYLTAAIVLLTCRRMWSKVAAVVVLLLVYSIPMACYGLWTPDNSFAFEVDRIVIGRFRGDLTYTWVWSSLTFGCTVTLGAIAGEVMMNGRRWPRRRIAVGLAIVGMGLSAAGLALSGVEPIIKRLWTSTMTLWSSGLCFMLMALTYWIVDVKGYSRGLNWLKIYGMNAITAYCLGEVVNFRSIVASLSYGLEPYIGQWYAVWLTFGNFLLLFLLLRYMYRHRIFLKI